MKILLISHVFAPSMGGIEAVSLALASGFVNAGHEVVVVTSTANNVGDAYPFAVERRPSMWKLYGMVQWCDVCFHNNISLRMLWPLIFVRRPWIVAHHTWIPHRGLAALVKRFVIRFAKNLAVSEAISKDLPVPAEPIANPYDDSTFYVSNQAGREREIIFVGRLVSDKGVRLLPELMLELNKSGHMGRLTIVGEGPERNALKTAFEEYGLDMQVEMLGSKRPAEVAQLLNIHQIMVVPSLWEEPFGLVALEAIACGCMVVGFDVGGLAEAIGPCGETVPKGDVRAMANTVKVLLTDSSRRELYQRAAVRHLDRHLRKNVTESYLDVFRKSLGGATSEVSL